MPFLVILLIIVVVVIFAYFYKSANNKKYGDETYLAQLERARKFLIEITKFDDYVTWKQRDAILAKYRAVRDFFGGKDNYYAKEPDVRRFNRTFINFKEYVDKYNEDYVARTIVENDEFFSDIEGNSLDNQQREAIVTDEYSNLVIAGAGSGKTKTILGKVLYLTEIKHVDPSRILLLSFTNKTVDDLNSRLELIPSKARATTFHKLGLGIIADKMGKYPNIANSALLKKTVRDYLKKDISKHPEQVQALVEFIACYSNIPEDYNQFKTAGERFDFYRGSVDYETLRSKTKLLHGVKSTLEGERVRSVEELMIANFLYLNGVKYEYEKQYPHVKFKYQPDFYLVDYDIWLEHFGIDEDGRVRWLNSYDSEKYVSDMERKRELHKANNTTLIETYSYYNKQHRLLEELEKILKEHGVELNRIDIDEVYDKISQDKYFGSQLEELIESFVNLCKSRNLSEKEIEEIFLTDNGDYFMNERTRLFFGFAMPILKEYQKKLDDEKSIDFHDMINNAADIVKKNGCSKKYDYIIVDEYQDISYSRFNLINTIREDSDAKLLCVGDDWQSIYRFAGSDISLFSDFEDFVGEYKELLIERTFRNSQELVDIASQFIQKNPMQIQKSPKSDKGLKDPISFVQYNDENLFEAFMDEIKKLTMKYGEDSAIMVLGRHSFDIDAIIYRDKDKVQHRTGVSFNEKTGKLKLPGIDSEKIFFATVHKSKGLEADNVIVLHMENSQYGFPNKLTDDPMLAPLLSKKEDYRFAEERRLFYVAMTRTKNETILMAPSKNESEFFTEIVNDNGYILEDIETGYEQVNCPWCETGKLMIRKNGQTGEQFLGCSHYPHCDQSYKNVDILTHPIRCSSCGSGFLGKISCPYGEFLGCTNWKPNHEGCDNKVNL